ncbi:MAG: 3-deoxy-8-phosphooctulonate synthase [Planctomycetota bacterium]
MNAPTQRLAVPVTDELAIGAGRPLAVIAGPCVIESADLCFEVAGRLKELGERHGLPVVFKCSFDKANRTSIDSYRGPGLQEGLSVLAAVRDRFGMPLLTDVHEISQVGAVAEVVDILQIPAFLCRQTDLVVEVARSGRVVNIKKGQFLSPWEVKNVAHKAVQAGNERVVITERGFSFGYRNLVADMRSIPIMQQDGLTVIFDATHSVQSPGGQGTSSGGDGWLAPTLARSAVAAGCDGLFLETHPDPGQALSDGPNMIPLAQLDGLFRTVAALRRALEDTQIEE